MDRVKQQKIDKRIWLKFPQLFKEKKRKQQVRQVKEIENKKKNSIKINEISGKRNQATVAKDKREEAKKKRYTLSRTNENAEKG